MWQRIQTVFLLLAALASGLLFLPVMSFFTVTGTQELVQQSDVAMLADGVLNIKDHISFQILAIVAALASLVAVFMFSNRPLQMALSRLTLVVSILILVLCSIFFYMDYQLIKADSLVSGEFGLLSPILGIVFSILALRFIKKDDHLVKSSDRLR